MPNKILTEEQQKLVENNHNLIYYFCNKKNLDIEDFYDIFAESLCKAALHYNPQTNSSFSNYVIYIMKKDLADYYKFINRKQRNDENIKLISLDDNLYDSDESVSKLLGVDYSADVESMIIEREIWRILTPKEANIVRLIDNGFSYEEICKTMNCTKSNISKIMNKVKKKVTRYLNK